MLLPKEIRYLDLIALCMEPEVQEYLPCFPSAHPTAPMWSVEQPGVNPQIMAATWCELIVFAEGREKICCDLFYFVRFELDVPLFCANLQLCAALLVQNVMLVLCCAHVAQLAKYSIV